MHSGPFRSAVFRAILCCAFSGFSVMSSQADTVHRFSEEPFGTLPDGRPVHLYTLRNSHGVRVSFMSYGGVITRIETPDRNGKPDDIVTGFPDLKGYLTDDVEKSLFFGAIVGRYANRIADGQFTLDGRTWHIPVTSGPNAIHGGREGFSRKLWTVKPLTGLKDAAGAELSLVSPDGDEGFPGTLHVTVSYILDDAGNLTQRYRATTDQPTVVNLTNHTYFNLSGEGSGSVEHQQLTLNAEHYTPVDENSVPTGEIAPVAGTPFDFRTAHTIGERLRSAHPQMRIARGYDHNWVIDGAWGKEPRQAAFLSDPVTGRTLTVLTTLPGLQVYTGNGLDGSCAGPSGRTYRQTDAVAFEAEFFPDSPNHPAFPDTTLRPGQVYDHTTVFRFGTGR